MAVGRRKSDCYTHALELSKPGLNPGLDLFLERDVEAIGCTSHADEAEGKGNVEKASAELHLVLSAGGRG